MRKVWTGHSKSLHLFVLWSFAVAQPLYDLIGGNAEFLVAHGAGVVDLIALVVLLSLAPPLVLVLAEAAIGLISPAARRWWHRIIVALLVALILLPLLKRIDPDAVLVPLIGSLAAAIAFTVAYAVSPTVRSFCSVLSPAVLIFPVIFIFFTPVERLLLGGREKERAGLQLERTPPIVMIVFDELNVTALLDGTGNIDPVRFPHFAELARGGWWFKNATAVYPETRYAIPSLLTGQYASATKDLPIYSEHPQNLFTWLAPRYRVRAVEPVTNLCPGTICPRDSGPFGLQVDPQSLLTDLAVVYQHIVLPRPLAAEWLLPIDFGWKGFAGGGKPKHSIKQGLVQSVREGRAGEFQSFVDGLLLGDGAVNFLHILLPHTPLQYLPTGDEYVNSSLLLGLAPDGSWSRDEALVEAAYLQYMLQVGFIDTMIGRLIDKLKAENQYDETLIVITADHGAAIEPGKQRRKLSEANAPAILQVSLLIKLPHQSTGQISDRRVSGIDLVATIADALGTTLPWPSDGHSAFAATFPARDVVEIPNFPEAGSTFRFPAAKLNFPRLKWQVSTFGERIPLEQTVPRGQWPQLLRRPVVDLQQAIAPPGLLFDADTAELFEDVRPGEKAVPMLVSGRIVAPDHQREPIDLALALNGVVVSTTRTFSRTNAELSFMLIAPVGALERGPNSLAIFATENLGGQALLRPIPSRAQPDFRIAENGAAGEVLTSASGASIPIVDDDIKGALQSIEERGGMVALQGWAVDLVEKRPASSVLVFSNGRLIHSGFPARRSGGVARRFKSDSLLYSGFYFELPGSRIDLSNGTLRLFAVSRGVASEVKISN
jgi:hypothetical protein